MDALAATAGLVAAGVLTPGPNNLLVLRRAAAGGWRAAAPAVGGILLGGLAVFGAVGGGAVVLARHDMPSGAMRVAAGVLLAVLGLSTLRGGREARPAHGRGRNGKTVFAGLFAFQFLNPKTWILVAAAVASAGGAPSVAVLADLAALLLVIPAASLALWCVAGVSVVGRLAAGEAGRLWLDRATGGALVAFAAVLLMGAFDVP